MINKFKNGVTTNKLIVFGFIYLTIFAQLLASLILGLSTGKLIPAVYSLTMWFALTLSTLIVLLFVLMIYIFVKYIINTIKKSLKN